MTKIIKVFTGTIKEFDENDRTLTAVVSNAEVDRAGEVIPTAAWKLDNYNKNPVILWAHDYSMPPVGKAIWTKIDGKGLVQKIKFATTEFAKDIYELYKGGFMNAFSVGFQATREESNPNIFKEAELYEVSCVPVPCNATALADRAAAGAFKTAEAKTIITAMIKDAADQASKSQEQKDNAPEQKVATKTEPEKQPETKIEETEDFIHIPVRDKNDFEQDSFRTIAISEDEGIEAVIGRPTGKDTTEVQKYIFAKAKGWTIEKAKKWVEDHSKAIAGPAMEWERRAAETLKLIGEMKAERKEGRVLSGKNRDLVARCLTMLQELMDASDPGKQAEPEQKDSAAIDKQKKSVIIIKSKATESSAAEKAGMVSDIIKSIDIPSLVRGELNRQRGIVE